MKVLVAGYYGKQNAGDDLLQHAISALFSPHAMLFTSWFPGVEALRSADVVVIGGGSIWPGNSFFAFGDQLPKEINRPIIVIGISARSQCDETLQKTRSLIRQARFFHVRDRQTATYFADPAVHCGPDLFWWTSFGPRVCNDARSFEDVLVNLREWRETNWDPNAVIGAARESRRDLKGWPLHFGAPEPPLSHRNDFDFIVANGVPATSETFQWNDVLSSRYVIAMRFHAVQIAIRLERPVIGFDYHPKIRAFFEENDLMELCVPLCDPRALRTAIQDLETHFHQYRQKVIALKQRLLKEADALRCELRAQIEHIAAEAKARPARRTAAHAVKNMIRRLNLH